MNCKFRRENKIFRCPCCLYKYSLLIAVLIASNDLLGKLEMRGNLLVCVLSKSGHRLNCVIVSTS